MDIKEFDKKYAEVGGIKELSEMRALLMPQASIAKRFGVSKERVRQWMLEFFGRKYDPRPARKKVKERSLKTLMNNIS